MLMIFEKLTSCAYIPDMEFPERTDPNFETKRDEYEAEEAVGVELFKADVLAHFGCVNNAKAVQAFEIAYQREKHAGLFAVLALFEDLLPLVTEMQVKARISPSLPPIVDEFDTFDA